MKLCFVFKIAGANFMCRHSSRSRTIY